MRKRIMLYQTCIILDMVLKGIGKRKHVIWKRPGTVVVDDNNNDVMSGRENSKNSKLPSFQGKGMERKDGKEGRRNSLVARCA